MQGLEEQVREQGWAPVEFRMSQADREEFMRLGRDIILLAVEDKEIADAFGFVLVEGLNIGNNNPTLYGVSSALNSHDDKLWLHSGYQTEDRVRAKLPSILRMDVVKSFFEVQKEVFRIAEICFTSELAELCGSTEKVKELFFPDDLNEWVMHNRLVRYLNLDKAKPGDEVIAEHTDMCVASLELSETHTNYLYGAPMKYEWIQWNAEPQRIKYVQSLRSQIRPIKYDYDSQSAFFLSAGIAGLNHNELQTGLDKGLPALDHVGLLPEAEELVAVGDWVLPHERVSNFLFLHPRVSILKNPELYRIPSVETCRPLLGVKYD